MWQKQRVTTLKFIKHCLILGFIEGFKLQFYGERRNSFSPNLLYAEQLPWVIEAKLTKEIELGCIAGPFDSPPVNTLWVSPVGVVPKKIQGVYRMIQHLSFPAGNLVNDGIPQEYSSVQIDQESGEGLCYG